MSSNLQSSNLIDDPQLFRHVLEDLPVGVYVVDRELRIRFWNHGAEQLTGYLAHEVVGHGLEEVVQACNRQGNSLKMCIRDRVMAMARSR